jgi:hypothetical protein
MQAFTPHRKTIGGWAETFCFMIWKHNLGAVLNPDVSLPPLKTEPVRRGLRPWFSPRLKQILWLSDFFYSFNFLLFLLTMLEWGLRPEKLTLTLPFGTPRRQNGNARTKGQIRGFPNCSFNLKALYPLHHTDPAGESAVQPFFCPVTQLQTFVFLPFWKKGREI